ncbi:hypothetical protein F4803DRAFT_543842 [Xylaria telfairii]|nr:hypothetical protein F4803DRAFT_543842 [Xylaria telfairii]
MKRCGSEISIEIMGNNAATSCLSAEAHDHAIKDPLVHYFGCLRFDDRDEFLNPGNGVWTTEKEHQKKLETARNTPKADIEGKATETVKATLERWEEGFDKELRRIELLRKTLEEDKQQKDNVVQNVNVCRMEWQKDLASRKGRTYTQSPSVNNHSAAGSNSGHSTYVVEKDISVGIIQFEKGEPFDENCDSLKDRQKLIWGRFPDQKTSVQSLLREGENDHPDQNLLHKDRIRNHPNRIRYFHIPSNNMIWAEEAISRYFGEDRPDFASFQRQLGRKNKTRSSIILQDRYWRGQLHADERGPPHARYMSPICETISSKLETTDAAPNNLVLFMPYLHWETSKKREYFALEMDKIMTANSDNKKTEEEKKRLGRIELRKRPTGMKEGSEPQHNPTMWNTARNSVKTGLQILRTTTWLGHKAPKIDIQGSVSSGGGSISRMAFAVTKRPSFKVERPLAKYLLAMSKLYEGMANYRDKILLTKYLPENPPLHPRRTLDQAFYWTLRTTKERDCDQVVFRGTTAKPDDFHRFNRETKKWAKHEEYKIQGTCSECTTNIQKLSRVVMVDQLWMWILDENTIITCFPKRYGANKNDASGIHKSIRSRVEEVGSVNTVFELGLIILDECSKTFFDRTKTLDRRPQVIDEFSRAIGNIMHEQTLAFNRLWRWTEQAKLVYTAKGYTDTSNLHMSLLDINPEGQLDREIEDIVEELDIMLHLANTHKNILQKFVEQAEHILDPKGEFKGKNGSKQWRTAEANLSLTNAEKEKRKERERRYQCFKQRANI